MLIVHILLSYVVLQTPALHFNIDKVKINKQSIKKVIEKSLVTSCLLRCENKDSCSNVAFEEGSGRLGTCYILNDDTDAVNDDPIEVYKYSLANSLSNTNAVDKSAASTFTALKLPSSAISSPTLHPSETLPTLKTGTLSEISPKTANSLVKKGQQNQISREQISETKSPLLKATQSIVSTESLLIQATQSIVSSESLLTQARESIFATKSLTRQTVSSITTKNDESRSTVVYLTCKEAVLHNFINDSHGSFFVNPDNQESISVQCLQVTKAANFTGMYENHAYLYKIDQDYVNITKRVNGDYQWKNRADVKWTLHPNEWNELRIGTDYPYYHSNTSILFTDEGVRSGGEFYTKEAELKDFQQPNELIKYANTLVLKRGLIFNVDSDNDNNNYWMGIENLARLTLGRYNSFILEFIHISGLRSYFIYRDFTINNQESYSMKYSRKISKGQPLNLLGNRKFKGWNGCPFDTSHWWDCTDKKQSPLVTKLSDMSSDFVGIEIYISTFLFSI